MAKPGFQVMQKLDGLLAIAIAFVPDETLAATEIIGAIPVDAVGKTRAVAPPPRRFACGCPSVAKVQIPMEVRFVNVEESHFSTAQLTKPCLKFLNVRLPLLWLGLGKQFLTFLPTQAIRFEQHAQQTAAYITFEDHLDPLPEFLQTPAITRQSVVDRCGFADCFDYLVDLFLVKRGERPPLLT